MGSSSRVRFLILAATIAAVQTLSAAAEAGTIAAETGTISLSRDKGSSGYSGDNGGGEFAVTKFSGGDPTMASNVEISGSYFQTFCLEKSDSVKLDEEFDFEISDSAKDDAGGTETSDPISRETAYLYTKFWDGTLSNYDYELGSGRRLSAAHLQNAIWHLENELTVTSTASQAWAWIQEAIEATDGDGYLDDWGGGIGNVRVLNLTDSNGESAQDQLFMVPLPPAAYMGLGGLVGLGLLRAARRRRTRD